MYVLVVNAGSSSLKYQLFDMDRSEMIAKGLCERIGTDGLFTHQVPAKGVSVKKLELPMPTHSDAVGTVIRYLTDPTTGCIRDMSEISAVGHRIVHGGPWLLDSVRIDGPNGRVLSDLRKCIDLAPLHTKAHLQGIEGCMQVMPDVPQVLVMDTAFHRTMPEKAYLYPIPYELYEKYAIRRYGFHGTSHRYVSGKALELLGNPNAKVVTCHLGNGSSISAVNAGVCVDTSMGFTPLEGVIMGSRCGVIDPAVVPFLMEKEHIPVSEMGDWMNKKCGFLGVSGVSTDLRDVRNAAAGGNVRAQLALDILAYQIKKYVGSYAAAMNGLDCVVFTAGIGENDADMRSAAMKELEFLGIRMDEEKNRAKDPLVISADDSRVKVLVIPTNEELVIASDTLRIVSET